MDQGRLLDEEAYMNAILKPTKQTSRILDRVAALERERNQLYEAMREVCHIVGGQTADGVSVEFLMNVPGEVRMKVTALERELAEARKPCPCRVRDAVVDAAMDGGD